MASTITNNSRLSDAYNIVSNYLQSTNNTSALNVLNQYQDNIYQQDIGVPNALGVFDGSKIVVDDNVTDTNTMAGILMHELTHAIDQTNDLAAGQSPDDSIQEEVSAFMATEDLMDSLGKGQYSQTGTDLRNLLTPEIESLYTSQSLPERSYGDEDIWPSSSSIASSNTGSTLTPTSTTTSPTPTTSTPSDTNTSSGIDRSDNSSTTTGLTLRTTGKGKGYLQRVNSYLKNASKDSNANNNGKTSGNSSGNSFGKKNGLNSHWVV